MVVARNTKLEDVAQLKAALDLSTKAVPADRLWLSPNCGLEFLPHQSAVKKLQLLRSAAN